MTDSKHTPGPWMFWDDSSGGYPKYVVEGDLDNAANAQIAVVEGDVEESKANAALIAAAPELLEAGERAAVIMRLMLTARRAEVGSVPEYDALVAALATARGEG